MAGHYIHLLKNSSPTKHLATRASCTKTKKQPWPLTSSASRPSYAPLTPRCPTPIPFLPFNIFILPSKSTFYSMCLVFWIQHSCFPECYRCLSFLHYHPFVFTQSMCFFSQSNGALNSCTPFFPRALPSDK